MVNWIFVQPSVACRSSSIGRSSASFRAFSWKRETDLGRRTSSFFHLPGSPVVFFPPLLRARTTHACDRSARAARGLRPMRSASILAAQPTVCRRSRLSIERYSSRVPTLRPSPLRAAAHGTSSHEIRDGSRHLQRAVSDRARFNTVSRCRVVAPVSTSSRHRVVATT
jgi:hypothetical protein